jgi:hypothetical protein
MMRPIHTSMQRPVPGALVPDGARAACKEIRDLVRFAVERRVQMMGAGHSRLRHDYVEGLLRPLQRWVDQNPTPSAETLKRLWKEQGSALRLVMPRNATKKLERLETLMLSL